MAFEIPMLALSRTEVRIERPTMYTLTILKVDSDVNKKDGCKVKLVHIGVENQ